MIKPVVVISGARCTNRLCRSRKASKSCQRDVKSVSDDSFAEIHPWKWKILSYMCVIGLFHLLPAREPQISTPAMSTPDEGCPNTVSPVEAQVSDEFVPESNEKIHERWLKKKDRYEDDLNLTSVWNSRPV